MTIAYVGNTLSSAANGDFVLAFAFSASADGAGSITTPTGWTSAYPTQGTYNYLRTFYVTSWSTSMSTSPSFGNPTLVVYGVYSGAYLDSITTSTSGTNGVAPSTTTSSSSDWIVSAMGFASTATQTPSVTAPTGMVNRKQATAIGGASSGYDGFGLTFSDTNGGSVPSGSSGTYTYGISGAASAQTQATSVALIGAQTPLAPTLVSPANGQTLDVTQSPAFTFVANYHNVDGSSCGAYALRMKISGASSYTYWNASSSTWGGSIVWNPGQMDLSYAGGMSDGNTYNYSFASQSSFGSSYQGPFAADATFTAQAAPTVTVTAPTGTQATSTPTVTWTATTASGTSQTSYYVTTYLASTTTSSGFTPGQSAGILDSSGIVAGNGTSYTIQTNLPNSSSLKSYVQITETNNLSSAWAASPAYSTLYAVPTTPTLAAGSGNDGYGNPCNAITVSNITVGNTLYVYFTDQFFPSPTLTRYGNGVPITGTSMTLYDYESTPGVYRTYYAIQVEPPTSADGNETLPSAPSNSVAALLSVSQWWLIDPVVPSSSVEIFVTASTPSEHIQATAHYPLGWEYPVIQADIVNGVDGTITVETMSAAQESALQACYRSMRHLWLISPFGDGKYVALGQPPVGVGIAGQLAQTTLNVSPNTTPYRTVVLQFVQVAGL